MLSDPTQRQAYDLHGKSGISTYVQSQINYFLLLVKETRACWNMEKASNSYGTRTSSCHSKLAQGPLGISSALCWKKSPEVLPNDMILLPLMSSKQKLTSCSKGVGVKLIVSWAHDIASWVSYLEGFLEQIIFFHPRWDFLGITSDSPHAAKNLIREHNPHLHGLTGKE